MPKSVFITGGTSGIGEAVAKKFLFEGHRVAICGTNRNKFIRNFEGLNIQFFEVDVTDSEQISAAIERFSEDGLDIVIACAGKSSPKKTPIPDFDLAKDIINLNVNGVLNTFEAALKVMLEKKSGHLVGVASIAGLSGFPGVAAYSASKSAVMRICESFAIDLKQFGIDVTCVNPGFVDTPLTRQNSHKMPNLVSSKQMAEKIYNGISKKKFVLFYPFRFTTFVRLLGILPRSIFIRLLRLKNKL